jgi:hypothetical protein
MSNDFQLNDKSIQHVSLLHKDLDSALELLPNFGLQDQETLSRIQDARSMISELNQILQHYVKAGKNYQQMLADFQMLLQEAGVSECVEDLIMVQRNARRVKHEQEEYLQELRRAG